jgi:hypothetical protein
MLNAALDLTLAHESRCHHVVSIVESSGLRGHIGGVSHSKHLFPDTAHLSELAMEKVDISLIV